MAKRWIPNILTVINLFAGMLAMVFAFAENWLVAAGLIIGAAFFDSLDGRVARRLNAASEFGKELDSLADLVSFGVAPAAYVYLINLSQIGWAGYVAAAVFPICGALRLARFNIFNVKGHFIGLPITIAGPVLTGAALLGAELPAAFHVFTIVILSGLMVSTIKVPKI